MDGIELLARLRSIRVDRRLGLAAVVAASLAAAAATYGWLNNDIVTAVSGLPFVPARARSSSRTSTGRDLVGPCSVGHGGTTTAARRHPPVGARVGPTGPSRSGAPRWPSSAHAAEIRNGYFGPDGVCI
jgi:hypothetical protein